MRATRLHTEYLSEPLGIDIVRPRFYWNCDGGTTQTAYRIVALRDDVTLWDSGKVPSARMTHVEWDGVPLTSRDRVDWTVTLWDENDVSGDPVSSWFEMGLLEPGDWTARWITGGYEPRRNTRYPVDCFRREFDARREIVRARLYVTACGIYQATINGQRAGDIELAPGSTDYRHRLHYQTYDVVDLIADGANTLEVQLADGWYRGSVGAFGVTNVFGKRTALLCQLELTYADGTAETIGSGDDFGWSDDGPIRFADLKDGEVYDARRTPSYRGRAALAGTALVPVAANNVAPRAQETFTPTLITTPSGRRVLDFGQNIAGFLDCTVHGAAGQTITLRLGEILDTDGEFTQTNIQLRKPERRQIGRITGMLLITGQADRIPGKLQPTPKQEVTLICSGGTDHYRTAFAVFGFRYVLVDTDLPIDPADFRAVAVYSDMAETGDFTCSNEDVNRLVASTRWSMKGNFLDVPTDCPTRERLGWTGDAQVFFDTATYFMDVAAFFRKWLHDVRDGRHRSGKPSAIAPYSGLPMLYDSTGGSAGWGDAAVLVPYRFWKRYGDTRLLREFYDLIRGYATYMIDNTGPDGVYGEKGMHLGEWLEPEEFRDPVGPRSKVRQTEVATAYLHYTMTCLTEIASELGETEDAALFRSYAERATTAYGRLAELDTDRQAKLVRPLALGLLDGDTRTRAQRRLVTAVENRDHRVGTGFLSTPFLLPVLTEAGRPDVAYQVLENEKAPSWLAQVKSGATTVWEDWEGRESRNHYATGAVCQWLFDTVAGIRADGENRFVVAPVPGGTLTWAEATCTTLYGTIISRWDTGGLTVTVPANTTAEIRLPDGTHRTAGAGVHMFAMEGAVSE
ncbi:family 78 glycoside hydrolase catalytic domain [Actinoplanes sp. NPDC051851]|uniref:family 78 glycoside hydrolase catalytic domain n=1 Tax=Actinoplanes sp. NPDC051851 TaxID=3154753 RepID=UPI0034155FAC